MTSRAETAIRESDVIVGYKTYIELVKGYFPDKQYISKGMRQELERCRVAVSEAQKKRVVSLISGGDVGIYGMASALFDYCRNSEIKLYPKLCYNEAYEDSSILVDIIPGVSSLNAAASILGAPISHDFVAISLSDHLTPWEIIEKRLKLAALGDFVIVLFNPRSRTRPHLLEKAISILLETAREETPVGIVKKAMRNGQNRIITELSKIPYSQIDMQTIIIIGNSHTFLWNDWMITPRGYHEKYFAGKISFSK